MKNIAMIGIAGAGKSFAAQYLAVNYEYEILSFGEPVKQLVAAIFGIYNNMEQDKARVFIEANKEKHYAAFLADEITLERSVWLAVERVLPEHKDRAGELYELLIKDEKKSPRTFCQLTGTDWGRDKVNKDIWVKEFKKALKKIDADNFVCDDVRFPNENKFLMGKKNVTTILIRTSRESSTDESDHISESHVYDLDFDHEVVNEFDEVYTQQIESHLE